MKRSAPPSSLQEIKRRQREARQKENERLEALIKAQKAQSAAQHKKSSAPSWMPPRPVRTTALPESPVGRRRSNLKDPPTSVETKQQASPASSVSFSQNDRQIPTPGKKNKKERRCESDEPNDVLAAMERKRQSVKQRRRKQYSSDDDSSGDDCVRNRKAKKQPPGVDVDKDRPNKDTRRRRRGDSGAASSSDSDAHGKQASLKQAPDTALPKERESSFADAPNGTRGKREQRTKAVESASIDAPSPAPARHSLNQKSKSAGRRSSNSSSDSDIPLRRKRNVLEETPDKSSIPNDKKNRRSSSMLSSDEEDDQGWNSNRRRSRNAYTDDKVPHNPLARAKSTDEYSAIKQSKSCAGSTKRGKSLMLSSSSEADSENDREKQSTQDRKCAAVKESDSDSSPPRRKRPLPDLDDGVVARNPLALSKASMNIKPAVRPSTAMKNGTDEIWTDSSEEEEESPDKKKKGKKRESPGRKKKAKVTLPDFDLDADPATLKPDFAHPLFGPGPLEPLLLEVPELDDDDDEKGEELLEHLAPIRERCLLKPFQVPASIARYLPGYQQEGVLFMFQTIFRNGGGILGDDMGCGKTVQVIALLAALLEKTGSYEDAQTLDKRQKLAREWTTEREAAQTHALERGELYKETLAPVPQHLPRWGPVMIMAPASILDNWVGDSATWGFFKMSLYQAKDQYSGVNEIRTGASEILLVSHKLFEMEAHFATLCELNWKLIIVDEHHKLKNPKTKMTTHLRELRDAQHVPVLGLTGTVMQNNHNELHCLIDLAAKDLVGSWKSFEAHFSRPIKLARAKDATPAIVELGSERSKELSTLMYKAYLRRTKEEVLRDELPNKDERIVFCELSELQKRIYQHMLEQPDFRLLRFSSDPCDCGVNRPFFKYLKKMRTKEDKLEYIRQNKRNIWRRAKHCYRTPIVSLVDPRIDPGALIWRNMHENDEPCPENGRPQCPYCVLFPAMHRLMKVCNHVALLQPESSPDLLPAGKKRQEAEKELAFARAFIPEDCLEDLGGSYIRTNSILDQHFKMSGKMKALDRLLRRIHAKGGRSLVFSASTQTLDLIENYIESMGMSFLRMDGNTDREKRKELADEFKKDHGIPVFLLSTRAMGLGLNLTAANYVIIFDVEWNPSNDAQAQDRAYRLGQTSDVVVFRLVSRGTLEELKYLRQVYKQQLKNSTIVDVDDERPDVAARLFRGVDGDRSRQGELFGTANLLRFKEGTFLSYGDETRDSNRFGGGIYNVESMIQAAQAVGDDGLEAIVDGEAGEAENIVAYAEEVDDEEETEGVQDIVGLTENEYPEARVSREEMLGAESQNIFDLYDNAGDNNREEDSDEESVNEVEMQRFVFPARSIQMAGESATSESNSQGHRLGRVVPLIPSPEIQASAGETSESGRNHSARLRHRTYQVEANNFAMPPIEPPSASEVRQQSEGAPVQAVAAPAPIAARADRWKEASERMIRRWAEAHNVDPNALAEASSSGVVPEAAISLQDNGDSDLDADTQPFDADDAVEHVKPVPQISTLVGSKSDSSAIAPSGREKESSRESKREAVKSLTSEGKQQITSAASDNSGSVLPDSETKAEKDVRLGKSSVSQEKALEDSNVSVQDGTASKVTTTNANASPDNIKATTKKTPNGTAPTPSSAKESTPAKAKEVKKTTVPVASLQLPLGAIIKRKKKHKG